MDNQQRSNQIQPFLEVYMRKLIENQKYEFRMDYYADENGHIWSSQKQGYLKEQEDKNGYLKVTLMTTDKPPMKGHRFSVHRLILSTFNPIENMENFQVDHIDGNMKNNNLSNLRWTSCQENLNNLNTKPNRRVYDQDGVNNASAIFTYEDLISLIKDMGSGNYTQKELMEKYNCCRATLNKIRNKEVYKQELKDIEIKANFVSDYKRNTKGDKNGRSKLTEQQVLEIIDLLLAKEKSQAEIARLYSISTSTINNIKKKRTWTHLTQGVEFD